jgi:hypothetical protein
MYRLDSRRLRSEPPTQSIIGEEGDKILTATPTVLSHSTVCVAVLVSLSEGGG